MTTHDKELQEEKDLVEEMEEEIEEIEDEEGLIDEEKLEEALNPEEEKTKDILAKTLADFENFKKRTQRDKEDMIFYLKSDIFKKILPRIDDLERIIKNTPEELQKSALFEGVISLEKALEKDLTSLGVQAFDSLGKTAHPNEHDIMTQIPGKPEGIICDEFEKGYMLSGKVLRHAKVVVGAGE